MKKSVIVFLFGLFVFSIIGVSAAKYLYKADEVSYEPTDTSWNVDNVDSAIKSLYSMVDEANSALTNLKNTDVAKAVGANGDTFSSVINKLGTIVDHKDKSFTLSDTNSITIPAGYYNGHGIIKTSNLIPYPSGTMSITSNGTYNVVNKESVVVDISFQNVCNEELGIDDCNITSMNQLKKTWSANVSVTYSGYGGSASRTFDMKNYVNISPINYMKIESVTQISKSATIAAQGISYTPGVTYNYSINGSKVTINTQNSAGAYSSGMAYYSSEITSTYKVTGWLL